MKFLKSDPVSDFSSLFSRQKSRNSRNPTFLPAFLAFLVGILYGIKNQVSRQRYKMLPKSFAAVSSTLFTASEVTIVGFISGSMRVNPALRHSS